MGNKVKFTMKNLPAGLSQVNSIVLDTAYNKLWSGVQSVSGADVELDIGVAGTVGNEVWIYSNNSTIGSESIAKVMGGFSTIEADTLPDVSWYDLTTGMVTCSNDLLECNSEVIQCL